MNLFRKLTASVVVAAAAAVALPALATPQTYVIDGTHTFPRFSYNHLGLSTQVSRFNNTSGSIMLDREARAGAVDIVIDMTSVDTGYETFNEHIQGADFFDTANHPNATFKSTRVVFDGDTPVAVDGELTIKGVTQPVTLQLSSFTAMEHPMLRKDAIGANASVTVKRSEFNAGKFAPHVSDEVTIDIAVEAIAQ